MILFPCILGCFKYVGKIFQPTLMGCTAIYAHWRDVKGDAYARMYRVAYFSMCATKMQGLFLEP